MLNAAQVRALIALLTGLTRAQNRTRAMAATGGSIYWPCFCRCPSDGSLVASHQAMFVSRSDKLAR